MYTMKVPEPIRAFFDTFPLTTLPAHGSDAVDTGNTQDRMALAVYNLDKDNLPTDPKSLEAFALIVLSGVQPDIKAFSPYISSAETLPLIYSNDQGKGSVITKTNQLVELLYPKDAQDAKYKVYRSLVDTWLDDAWQEYIMNATDDLKQKIFGSNANQFPWPFSVIANRNLDAHLEDKKAKERKGTGDNYVCSPNNLNRARMTMRALENAINDLKDAIMPIDILVFSYIWPICEYLPESELASLISEKLRLHAQHVRQSLLQ